MVETVSHDKYLQRSKKHLPPVRNELKEKAK